MNNVVPSIVTKHDVPVNLQGITFKMSLPRGSGFMSLQMVKGRPVLWVHSSKESVNAPSGWMHTFLWVRTNQVITDINMRDLNYIGTVQMHLNVYHLFEVL